MPGFNGIFIISEERRRQIEDLGYLPADDMQHRNGELARAAAILATPPELRDLDATGRPTGWPFPDWSDLDREDEIVRAGALLAAELDRVMELRALEERAAQARAVLAEATGGRL